MDVGGSTRRYAARQSPRTNNTEHVCCSVQVVKARLLFFSGVSTTPARVSGELYRSLSYSAGAHTRTYLCFPGAFSDPTRWRMTRRDDRELCYEWLGISPRPSLVHLRAVVSSKPARCRILLTLSKEGTHVLRPTPPTTSLPVSSKTHFP